MLHRVADARDTQVVDAGGMVQGSNRWTLGGETGLTRGCRGRSVGADRRTLGGGATAEDVGCAVQGRILA
jgi:hypothetical protein